MLLEVVEGEMLRRVAEEAVKFYRGSHHDLSHVERVYRLAMRIARELGAGVDLEVLGAAAILHDVARSMEDEGLVEDHAREGARIAREILKRVGFPEDKIERVAYCIEAHRYRGGGRPSSIEAQILQDADRLDALGAIGVARAFARGGARGTPFYDPSKPPKERYDGHSETVVNHFYEKLLKVKDTLNTEPARRIAEGRHRFMEEFLERFLKEWVGEA
ncbi:HD domain-containing protein [Thermofilum pendens]|uniref:Metal dependent phosphohydrolase n=1 Tax=Thermofilum pendens (strain DSM 2475 / Hrk 5) TaxID=368408 RepID=A1RZD0_THEPD|nr:HD domain-containing protein [Thermofilum pendens]ABL78560.1 metal dependent phosphohydrolase [Thermofilum pendens Hrk 5]